MFLKSFKIKYPEMSDLFVQEQIIPKGLSKDESEYYQELSQDSKDLVNAWLSGVTFSIKHFYQLRKEVADLHYKKHLEYVTSHESETYWTS